jgi:hypothetical protein
MHLTIIHDFFHHLQAASELRDADSWLTEGITGLASDEDYKAFWNRIAECDTDIDASNKRLWLRVQEALNEELAELFVIGAKNAVGNPILTIDDDKMHYAMRDKAGKTDGLKSESAREGQPTWLCVQSYCIYCIRYPHWARL